MGKKENSLEVLVTGGGGFLGKALVSTLLEKGHRVRSFSRSRYPELESMGARCVQGDLGDAGSVDAAIQGCDAVFHVAAKADAWGEVSDFERTNVLGTKNVIDACIRHQVRALIHTSSPSVVPENQDIQGADESIGRASEFCADYPRTKAKAEELVEAACRDKKLRAVILRPHLIYGPGDPQLLPRLLSRYKSGRLRRVGAGHNKVDVTHIQDAVASQLCALKVLLDDQKAPAVNGKAYFISSGEPIPLWEMVDKMLATQGAGPVKSSIPAKWAEGIGAVLEVWGRLTGSKKEPAMTRWIARKMSHHQWFDLSAAQNDLDYHPSVSNAQGLESLRP